MLRPPGNAPNECSPRTRAVTANVEALMFPGFDVDAILDNLNDPYTLLIRGRVITPRTETPSSHSKFSRYHQHSGRRGEKPVGVPREHSPREAIRILHEGAPTRRHRRLL